MFSTSSLHHRFGAVLPIRSERMRRGAAGYECLLRLATQCRGSTVLCHVYPEGGKSGGTKGHDLHGVYGCDACHAIIDGRDPKSAREIGRETILSRIISALIETQSIHHAQGYLVVPDDGAVGGSEGAFKSPPKRKTGPRHKIPSRPFPTGKRKLKT